MRSNIKIDGTERRNPELVRLWLAVAVSILHAGYWVAIHSIDQLRELVVPHTAIPLMPWLTDAVFLWLVVLLWIANRQWRESIRRETQLQRMLSSIAFEALIVVTPDRTITHCSPTVESLFGYTEKELVGQKTDMLYSDRRVHPEQREIHDDLENVGFHVGFGTGHRRGGEEFPIELTTAKLRGAPGGVILIRDVTEQKLAEETLRRSRDELERRVQSRTAEFQKANEALRREAENRRAAEKALQTSEEAFRTLVESAMSAIMIVSNADRILYANRKGAEIVGSFAPQFLIGADIGGVLQPPMWKDAAQPGTGNPSVRTEAVVVRSDGGRVPIDLAAAPTLWRGEAGTLLIFDDITYRHEAEARMLRDQKQLRRLAAELSVAEEGERRRIAVALHDGIGQTLALCNIRLGSVLASPSPSPEAGSAIANVQKLVESAIRETRALTVDLSPPVLYELGLDDALEWLAEELHRQYKKPIDFRADGHAKPLDESVRGVIFRAARELIVNAVKHAEAKRIRIHSHCVGANLHVAIEDDGKGFAVPEQELRARHDAGFGLFYIRERMDFLGGKLVIDSKLGRGTRVTLVAPFKEVAADKSGDVL